MAGRTVNYGLLTLGPGEALSTDGYAFTQRNIDEVDRLLKIGAETHRHTGEAATLANPALGPALTLDTTVGNLPAGVTVSYRYSYVDATGAETAASPMTSMSTPFPVSAPAAPTLSRATTGGTLLAGMYYYGLTAYTGVNTAETTLGDRAQISLTLDSSTWTITLTLPTLPAGADGFNVYRRAPGESEYSHLTTIDMKVATPPTTYLDDGSLGPNCHRVPPFQNVTNTQNSIVVSLPGDAPALPEGAAYWKLYRTYTGTWNNSLLASIVEETAEGSGIITTTYEDVGNGTLTGAPSATSNITGSPSKIDLATETEGNLPVGTIISPLQISFAFPGPLAVAEGTFVWICEYDYAEILSVRAVLGRGSTPNATPVIVDLNRYTPESSRTVTDAATTDLSATLTSATANFTAEDVGRAITGTGIPANTTIATYVSATEITMSAAATATATGVSVTITAAAAWTTLFTTQANRPTVPVDQQMGAKAVPDITALREGDLISVDIDQIGGGTNTDEDLLVTIFMLVRDENTDDLTGKLGLA